MSERIVVDPITRIEGHLRVEVDVDEKGLLKEPLARVLPFADLN